MFSKKWWNIYSFSKDTVWVFSSTTAIFLEADKIGNFRSSENHMEASRKEEKKSLQGTTADPRYQDTYFIWLKV